MVPSRLVFRPAALVALSLALTSSATALAAGSGVKPAPVITPCSAACAQQSLASALHDPIRIGNTHVKLAVAASKLTVGWSIAF